MDSSLRVFASPARIRFSLNKVKIFDHLTETKVIYLEMARWHKLFFDAGNIPGLNIQKENVSQKKIFSRGYVTLVKSLAVNFILKRA
jgi:hypothetical protein